MSTDKHPKSWDKLIDGGKKNTTHKIEEEIEIYPWRKSFMSTAPDVAKPSLKRDFELGLVYPITEQVMGARKACHLDPMPPTAHKFPEMADKKRAILDDMGTGKKLAFDTKKRVYDY
ncbi:MAG: hdrC-like protein [Candidatus Methanomethylicaceae archaeon]|jgi:heterodisulfide reductase subunit C